MQRQDLNFLLRISLIAILTGLFAFESFAQTKLVAGVVKDQSGEPLIGVNVMEKGTTNGSINLNLNIGSLKTMNRLSI